MSIVERIKFLCKLRKISVAELERTLRMSNSTIRKWDINKPSVDKIEKVADYFNVSVDYLLGRSDEAEFEEFISDPTLQIMMREIAESDEEKRKQLRQMWDIIKDKE